VLTKMNLSVHYNQTQMWKVIGILAVQLLMIESVLNEHTNYTYKKIFLYLALAAILCS
jgi:hypothetical protein